MNNTPDINKNIISGMIRDTPISRRTNSNKEVLNFFLANRRKFIHSTTGEEIEKIVFISISCWGRLVDMWKDKLKKGCFVYVEGALQSRSWDDKEGKKQNIIEINASEIQLLHTGE